jgi:hypothetical protein
VDVPTLKCDRCGRTTQDLHEMASYKAIRHSHMSGEEKWDLCPVCFILFIDFITREDKK